MEFRTLTILVAVLAPWSAAGLQIFSEGSTKPPHLFQTPEQQDQSAVDYGYASFKNQFKSESGDFQKDSSVLKFAKKSAQNPFLYAELQSGSEPSSDLSQFVDNGKVKSDSSKYSVDLIKQYKKQQLLKQLAELEEPSQFTATADVDYLSLNKFAQQKYAAKPQILKEGHTYGFHKTHQLTQKDAQEFDSFIQSADQKQAVDAAKQAFYASKTQISQEEPTFNIHKVHQLAQKSGQQFGSFGQSDDQKQAFLLKWGNDGSEPVDQSGKMAGQVDDAAKYYKVISTFKVSGNQAYGHQFSQHPVYHLKQKASPYSGDSDQFSFGFGKKPQQPEVFKVVKIVKSPFTSVSSFGAESPAFVNPFQKQIGNQKIIQKVQILKPIHYTNTFGLKTRTPVDPIQAKPIGGFAVRKVIKPLIVY